MFSDDVCKKIGNYVYRLIDPRNGETFYIGKGRNNRVFQHVSASLKATDEDGVPIKIDRIKEIHRAGLEVIHVIHRHEIPDQAIDHVEAALIDAFSGLSNIQGGYASNSYGPMHAEEIIAKYDLPELDYNPPHKLVLINVNRSTDLAGKTDYYRETRYAWRIKKEKVEKADYILSVVRGVIKQVFVAEEWLPATQANFPEIATKNRDGRHGFIGYKANKDILEYYVGKAGKRITNPDMKHVQNPIRYWNI